MQTKTVLNGVAKVVKTKRQAKGQSIAKLASLKRCSVSETTIRRIEAGRNNYTHKLDTLVKLANGLNISVNTLIKAYQG